MGIDQIRLSAELIKSLYPETLVGGTAFFLGKNLKRISFLVYCHEFEFLPEDQIVFLHKMLSACKLSLDDIAVINTAHVPLTLDDLRQQLQPVTIFLWGVRPDALSLDTDLPDFTISTIDGISVIQVPTPDLLIGNNSAGQDLKQRLWTCLKKLFIL
jgi:hypothetical protein